MRGVQLDHVEAGARRHFGAATNWSRTWSMSARSSPSELVADDQGTSEADISGQFPP
jgi:hypothetical protein